MEYAKSMGKFSNLNPLYSASSVGISERNEVKIVKHNPELLESVLEKEQKEMIAIMELNYRILNNLNEKIKVVY